ncbi:hypothetical protein [Paraburkholderia tropica]|uniref:hypothetical protein n=1 Tax=Paraburkholderia tropica TaxID=92647 RepID=UPI002ABD2592|nr:hypothetical protein [Paraburkholderia tropica]
MISFRSIPKKSGSLGCNGSFELDLFATGYWPFTDLPDTVAIANKKIVIGGEWIACVTHDLDDGMWQFHTSDSEPPSEDDVMVVSLRNVFDLDSSIAELVNLPLGWHAWRVSHDAPWQRSVM